MADRYNDNERNRYRDRNEREGNEGGNRPYRFDDGRAEFRDEGFRRDRDQESNRSYGGGSDDRRRGNDHWRGEGPQSRFSSQYEPQTSGTGQESGEDWRSREHRYDAGQRLGGGLSTYSGQDWRNTSQGPQRGGLHEGTGGSRTNREFDRGYNQPDYDAGFGSSYGQSSWNTGSSSMGQSGFANQNTGGRFTGRGPKGYQRSDDRIREDVCERLTQHPDIDASQMDVQVSNGEVTLTGSVDDRNQKRLAEDAIESLSGVREVHNQIRISHGGGQQSTDTTRFGNREQEANRTQGTGTTASRQTEQAGSTRR